MQRTEQQKPITARLFKQKFPEFEYILPREKTVDLIDELRQERMYVALSSAFDEILTGEDALAADNAIEKALQLREIVDQILRASGAPSFVLMKAGGKEHYERVKNLSTLRDNGEIPGIPTGLAHLDFHLDGLQGQTTYLWLGRPGDAKSFSLAQLATEAAWHGYRAFVFSPEMTEHAHMCRFHTLLSAKPEVQQAVGIREAFRNRALKSGRGFNLKAYKRFLDWLDTDLPGEIALFTMKYRRERMTVSYIDSVIGDSGANLVIVDPIYKLSPPRRRGTRWEELGEITDALVNLSHAHNIPVVISNQANRALVGRDDAPSLNSSFGSDTPVQEGDVVIGVKHYSEERILKYRCSKNRHGERFRFTAKFVPNMGILQDITPLRQEWVDGFDAEKLEELTKEIEGD